MKGGDDLPDKKELKRITVGSVKIISFALVFVVIIQVLSLTCFSKRGAATYRTQLNKAYAFLQEPDNSIDVLCIGNSDLYSSIVPAQLWTDKGYTCSLISSPRQTPQKSYAMLQTLYEHQKPKVVAIETDMLYDEMVEDRESVVNDENPIDVLYDRCSSEHLDNYVINFYSILTFHDRWKHARNKSNDDIPDSHGYKFSSETHKVVVGDYMQESGEAEPIKKINKQYLSDMIALCRDNGSEVFLIECPSVTSWNSLRHNAVASLSEELGVPFVDFNLLVGEIGIDLRVSFRDKGNHLNYDAACEVTKYLGNYIASSYDVPDRRSDDDFKFYDNSIKRFYKQIDREKKKPKRA